MVDDSNTHDSDEVKIPDRPRGILTRSDRELLLNGDEDKTKNDLRDARYRIRKRIKNSLSDFALLTEYLDSSDLELVFEDIVDDTPYDVVFALSFIYLGNRYLVQQRPDDEVDESFNRLVTIAVQRAERSRGYLAKVEGGISISREDPSVGELITQLKTGKGTANQYNYIAEHGSLQDVWRNIVESGEPLYLWDDEGTFQEGDTDNAYEITPAQAERMLEIDEQQQ